MDDELSSPRSGSQPQPPRPPHLRPRPLARPAQRSPAGDVPPSDSDAAARLALNALLGASAARTQGGGAAGGSAGGPGGSPSSGGGSAGARAASGTGAGHVAGASSAGARLNADPASRPPATISRRRGGPVLRLLPVTIFVAGLMLTVRLNDIWTGLHGGVPLIGLTNSIGQQPAVAKESKKAEAPPAKDAGKEPAKGEGGGGHDAPPKDALPPEPKGGKADAAADAAGEQPSFTQNEVLLLQKLAERREALDARERDLNMRENLVAAAEARIEKKVGEMKSLQSNIEQMLHQMDEQDEAHMRSLVKIYETMKPKDAARIFEQLDMPVLMGVLQRMKEQKVAPVMEAMDPSKAKVITAAMAEKRSSRFDGAKDAVNK